MKTVIVDGNAFTWKTVTTAKTTNYVYRFFENLLVEARELGTTEFIVVFDGRGGSEMRKGIDPQYKANRKVQTPERVKVSEALDQIHRVLADCPRFISVPGVEGDDIISILAHCQTELKIPTVILSKDKDLYQCLTEQVSMRDGHRKPEVGVEALSRYGDKRGYILYKALKGDHSDNIPGIRGISDRAINVVNFWRKGIPINSKKMQRLLQGNAKSAKWTHVFREKGFREELAKQVKLVTTATDPRHLGRRCDDVMSALVRIRCPKENISYQAWSDFLMLHNLHPLISATPILSQILGFNVIR